MTKMKSVSIIVGTYNRSDTLREALNAMLLQNYEAPYEILVIDDGSTDGTKDMVEKEFGKNKKIRLFFNQHLGPIKTRNTGFKNAKNEIVVIMDDDCIPEKSWLRELTGGLTEDCCGISSFSPDGGTSTAFRRKEVLQAGMFDERFNKFPYREDTDLKFRLEKMTEKKLKFIEGKAKFRHVRNQPKTFLEKIKYGLYRIKVHQNDVLLYKKHPKETAKMLDIKFGFIRNPAKDFAVATGLWGGKKSLSLSSPQGVEIIQNKTFLHAAAIILIGIAYVFAVKASRLYGSIIFGKLLI